MSSGHVKVDGTPKKITGAWTKVDGVWKKGDEIKGKINGVWKELWKNAFDPPSFLSYPATITRGDNITWNTEDIIGAHYEIQTRYNNSSNWSSSTFATTYTGSFKVSTNVSYTTFQMRVRAVAPNSHDKQSSWVEGPVRSLKAQKLSKPAGLSYSTNLTRGQNVTIKWTASSDVKYTLQAVYNGKTTVTVYSGIGGGSKSYAIPTSTGNSTIQFKIKARKNGYIDSDFSTGTNVTLKAQTLGSVGGLKAPVPYQGQTITVSWGSVKNAQRYLLELQYNDGAWTKAYSGSNRSFSKKISTTSTGIQWRVRAEANNYNDGPWTYSTQSKVNLPPTKKTTWSATRTKSWRSKSDWGWRDPSDVGDPASVNYVYQGAWNSPPWWGNHRGLAWFNYSNMRSVLKGKTIIKTRVYFYRINKGGYVAGQKIKLWTHNYSNVPSGRPELSFVQGPFSSFARGEGKWITVSNAVAERIRDGKATGIALYREDEGGYLYMSSNVKIEITYR